MKNKLRCYRTPQNEASLREFLRRPSCSATVYPPVAGVIELERDAGIEPANSVWKTEVLPLN